MTVFVSSLALAPTAWAQGLPLQYRLEMPCSLALSQNAPTVVDDPRLDSEPLDPNAVQVPSEPISVEPTVQVVPVPIPKEPPAAAPTGWHWYGWQILVTGGVAGALFASGEIVPRLVASGDPGPRSRDGYPTAVAVLLYGAFALSGPIVHLSHENVKKAIGSLAMNIIAPYMAVVIFSNFCSGGTTDANATIIDGSRAQKRACWQALSECH